MLYSLESGTPDQPAIILLHGGGLSSKMWQPVMDQLNGFHCLAPDMPEHGQSSGIAPFDLDDTAQRVAELVRERVPGGKAHVCGLSLGGAVVLTLARLAPEVIDHGMVTGTAAGVSKFLGQLSLASLWMFRMYKPAELVKVSLKQFAIPAQYAEMFTEDLLHSNTEAFNRTLIDNLMRMQLPESINFPLLATVGEKETIPAKQAAQKITRLYPSATGRTVNGLGHVWALQNPTRFAATLRAWFTDCPLPEGLRELK